MATPATDLGFLSEVEDLVETRGEILVEFRYAYAAGSRDIMVLHSFPSFQEQIVALPPRTLVEVYRRYDLPLRGAIDETMIQAALTLLPGETEYLVVYLRPRNDSQRAAEYDQGKGWLGSFQNDEGQENLAEDLRDTLGEQAAIGPYSEWHEASGNVLRAVVPNADGSVQVGTY